MASQFDDTDFVDRELQAARHSALASPPEGEAGAESPANPGSRRAPSRQELENQVGATQQRLAELKRQQEQLERERSALEEIRRRRAEFNKGRDEMMTHLTRGVGILEETELNARREVEQMTKTLQAFRDDLQKVGALSEESWNVENLNVELTRALTTIENARMEWNTARLKWPVLEGKKGLNPNSESKEEPFSSLPWWKQCGFTDLCKLGFALSWPIALVALAGVIMLAIRVFQ